MAKQRNFQRTDRVARELQEILAGLLLRDVRDPRVQDVQITNVRVSGDMRHARVFYVLLEAREASEEVEEALAKLTGYLRRCLSHELRMKHTPILNFEYDESVERGRRMETLLAGLHAEEE